LPEDRIIHRALIRAKVVRDGNILVENSTIVNEDFLDGLIHALEWITNEITDEEFMLYPRGTQDEEDELEFDPEDYTDPDEEDDLNTLDLEDIDGITYLDDSAYPEEN
jgi:hypothetical protein